MANTIKGITVEIGANATQLTDALSQIKKEYAGLDKTANALTRSMSFKGMDIGGIESHRIKAELLEKQYERTQQKLAKYNETIKNMPANKENWEQELEGRKANIDNLQEEVNKYKEKVAAEKEAFAESQKIFEQQKANSEATQKQINEVDQARSANEKRRSEVQDIINKKEKEQTKLLQDNYKNAVKMNDITSKQETLEIKVREARAKTAEKADAWYKAEKELADFQNDSSKRNEMSLKEQGEEYERLALKVQNSEIAYEKAKDTVRQYEKQIEDNKTTLKDLNKQIEDNNKAYTEGEKSISSYKGQMTKLKDEQKQLASQKGNLSKQLDKEKKAMEEAGDATEEHAKNIAELERELNKAEVAYDKNAREIEQLQGMIDNYDDSLQTLIADQQTLNNELRRLEIESFEESDMVQNVDQLIESLDGVSDTAETAYQALLPLATLSATGMAASVKTAMDFESAWAGVTKTVEGTPRQLEALNQQLQDLAVNTGTAYEDIAYYGELAGQMGVAVDDVAQFTSVINDLGVATNIVGEEAAQKIAKFANIMSDEFTKVQQTTGDYYERLGSTIVDLGNNFATTENDIVEMAQKLAAAGHQTGMSSAQVLALATTLSSLGMKTDEAAGSMSKFLQKIQVAVETGGEELADFAEVSNMSVDEFVQAWQDDAPTALLAFVEGLNNCADGSTALAKLADMGLTTEIRLTRTLGAMTNGTDLYSDALGRANTAWADNTAMAIEAEKRYDTTERAMAKTQEAVRQLGNSFGQLMMPAVEGALNGVTDFIKGMTNLTDGTKKAILAFGGFTIGGAALSKGISIGAKAVSTFLSYMKKLRVAQIAAGAQIKNLGTYFKNFGSQLKSSGKLITQTVSKMSSLKLAFTGIVGVLGLTAAAYAAWKLAQDEAVRKAVDEKLAMDGVYQVYTRCNEALKEYVQASESCSQAAQSAIDNYEANKLTVDSLAQSIEMLAMKENRSAFENEYLRQCLEEINKIYPEFGLQVDEATGKLVDKEGAVVETTEALDQYIQKLHETAAAEAYQAAQTSYIQAIVNDKIAIESAKHNLVGLYDTWYDLQDQIQEKIAKGETNDQAFRMLQEEAQRYIQEIEASEQILRDSYSNIQTNYQQMLSAIGLQYQDEGERLQALSVKMDELVQQANQAGVQIPQNLVEGIKSGDIDWDTAVGKMTMYNTLSEMASSATTEGEKIVANVANGMLNAAPDMASANAVMNGAINFTDAQHKVEIFGADVTTELARRMMNGSATVRSAADQLCNAGSMDGLIYSMQTLDYETDKGVQQMILNILSAVGPLEGASLDAANAILSNFSKIEDLSPQAQEQVDSIRETINGLNTNPPEVSGTTEAVTKDMENANTAALGGMKTFNSTLLSGFNEGKANGKIGGLDIATAIEEGLRPLKDKVRGQFEVAQKKERSSLTDMKRDASSGSKNIGNAMGDGTANATSAVGRMGSAASSTLSSYLSAMLRNTRSTVAEIKSELKSAQDYARNNKITITTEKKTVYTTENKGGGSGSNSAAKVAARRPVVDTDAIEALADEITAPTLDTSRAVTSESQIAVRTTTSGIKSDISNARIAGQVERLVGRMDMATIEHKLDILISLADKDIYMDSSKVGKLLAKPIREENDRQSWMNNALAGAR